jgi:hypothetical protein
MLVIARYDMVRFDVELNPKLDKQFRLMVMRRKGMKKGNLSESIQEAVKLWLRYDGRELPTTTTPKPKVELIVSAPAS